MIFVEKKILISLRLIRANLSTEKDKAKLRKKFKVRWDIDTRGENIIYT